MNCSYLNYLDLKNYVPGVSKAVSDIPNISFLNRGVYGDFQPW